MPTTSTPSCRRARAGQPRSLATILLGMAVLAGAVTAQVDPRLVGTWVGQSGPTQGARVVVEKDQVVLDGEPIPARTDGEGVLVLGVGAESERIRYALRGEELVIVDETGPSTWRRQGGAGAPANRPSPRGGRPLDPDGRNPLDRTPRGENPLDQGNPLAKKVPADRFARTFRGDGLELDLNTTSASGYTGTITLDGRRFRVGHAAVQGDRLTGSFTVDGGGNYGFEAVLEGDRMSLRSGGTTYELQSEVPTNPLRRPSSTNDRPGSRTAAAPVISAQADVAGHLPRGWTVLQQSNEGCVINPGFQQGARMDVTVTLHSLPLEASDRGIAIDRLLLRDVDDVRSSLRDEGGLQTGRPSTPRTLDVDGVPAASITMPAQTRDGMSGTVWFAVRIVGDRGLATLGIFLGGTESAYQPKVEQLFRSLQSVAAAGRGPRPVIEHAVDADDAHEGSSTARPAAPGAGTLRLRKKTFHDPQMGTDSHTLMVPDGYRVDGGVVWSNHESNYVNFVAAVSAPDGREARFDSSRSFVYSDPQSLARQGQRLGQTLPNGTTVMTPPQQAGQAALHVLLPEIRPHARNARIVKTQTHPEAEAAFRKMHAQSIASIERDPNSQTWLSCETARLEYEENGQLYEEEICYTATGAHFVLRSEFFNADNGLWSVYGVRSIRAPKGQLEAARGELTAVVASLRETPRWSIARNQLAMQISQIRHQGNMARIRSMGEMARKTSETLGEISDIQMAGWREREGIRDDMQRATINGIHEVNEWASPSGRAFTVSTQYSRVFEDRAGNLIMTDDPSFQPDPSWNALGRTGR